MRLVVVLVFSVFLLLWALFVALFSGAIPSEWLPDFLLKLEPPSNFAHLGEAMGTLDGLFSSIAIVLGLVAILLQGKELKASTDAQAIQAEALTQQLSQQSASNRLGAYSARLSYLTAEIKYLDDKINSMVEKVEGYDSSARPEDVERLWTIIRRTRDKERRYRKEAEAIDVLILEELNSAHLSEPGGV